VIHGAFGLVEHICDIARRFANIGYNALAPDLYGRAGGPKDPSDINNCAAGHVRPGGQAGSAGSRSRRGRSARPPPILDLVNNLHCPLFAVFGKEDQNPPVAMEAELTQRAAASGKRVTTKIYQDAGHAFLADYRPSYREKPAIELWTDITGYFGQHLKSTGPVRASHQPVHHH
jgi:carboxymethylenebutenolidase